MLKLRWHREQRPLRTYGKVTLENWYTLRMTWRGRMVLEALLIRPVQDGRPMTATELQEYIAPF